MGYDIVEGDDIMDINNLTFSMLKFQPTIVIHLAALSSVTACNEDVKKAIKINGIGTRNVLNAMKLSGCNNIIYASTSAVYGDNAQLPYTESDNTKPCSNYGISKLLGEDVIYNYFDLQMNDGSYLIYRMFNVIGTSGFKALDHIINLEQSPIVLEASSDKIVVSDRKPHNCDRLFASLESGNIIIYGRDYPTLDGTCERDYIALKDICLAYISGINMILQKNRVREIINICTEIKKSVIDIIEIWNNISRTLTTNRYCSRSSIVKYIWSM